MIAVEGVTHLFPLTSGEPVVAIKDLSFTVEDKSFFSIVGPSGCGKTTLLRILDGLVKPTSGRVVIDGTAVTGPDAARAMIFQDFRLMPWRTVERNIGFGLEILGVPRAEIALRVARLVSTVGLEGFQRAYPHQLSGGMQQRVALARALALDPKLLLMDEPFGALDAQTRELMQYELLNVLSSGAKTVIFITHSIDEAVYLSDEVLVLRARPSRVQARLRIDLPRPRTLDVRNTIEFINYRREIAAHLGTTPTASGVLQ